MTKLAPQRQNLNRVLASWRVILGAVVFVAALVVMAPASTVVGALSTKQNGVAYRAVEGTIWNGVVRGLTFDDIRLGDIRFDVRPLSLLRGAVSVRLHADGGAVEGAGGFAVGIGVVEIRNLTATVRPDAIERYYLLGAPVGGEGRVSIDHIVYSQKGCRAAKGALETDVLSNAMMRLGRDAVMLSGTLDCENGDLAARLSGASADGRIDVAIRVKPNLHYDLTVNVAAATEDVRRVLTAFGFQESGGVLVYSSVGALNGAKA